MMRMTITHGRHAPCTGGTDLDGNEIDDWGFEGPTLEGVVGITFVYNNYYVRFADPDSFQIAAEMTMWKPGPYELSLELKFEEDCLKLFNSTRMRYEYFGDWGIYQPA